MIIWHTYINCMKIYRKKEGLFGKEKRKSKRIHTGSIADSVHCIVTEFYSGTGVRQYSAGIYFPGPMNICKASVWFRFCGKVNVFYGGTCRRQHA